MSETTNSPVPAPARETTKDDHTQRLLEAAIRVLDTDDPPVNAAVCAALALETCAALDALAEASKFFPEFITAYEGEWRDGEWGWETRALKRLLDCISTLTDSPTP